VLKALMKVRNKMDLNIRGNLMVGNNAMALLVAAMTVGIAIIAEAGLNRMIGGTEFGTEYMKEVLLAELLVLIGIILAIALIYIALAVADKLFKNMDLLMEVRDGNAAVALVMSVVIIVVCYFGRSAMSSISAMVEF
jgi:hypothetical protein